MRKTGSRAGRLVMRCSSTAKVIGLAAGLLPLLAAAEPWQTGIILDLGIIHTDNVFLDVDGAEDSETVYTIAPQFFLEKDDDRLQANLRYRPEAYFYSDHDDADEVFHTVDASLTANLLRDRFYVELTGVNFQSIETPEREFPTSNLPITGNRVDSPILAIRPYWQQKIGTARLRLDTSYRDLEYDDSQFQSSNERFGSFSLGNVEEQQGIAWDLSYSYRRLEYELSTPFDFQRAGVNLGYWFGSSLRLFGAGGAESSAENPFDSNLDEDFWEAGFQYAPDERLNLEIAAGERSYGSSLRADLSYRLRRGDLSLVYSETPSSRSETVFQTQPLINTDNLDNFLDRPGASDRFVRKRAEARLSIDLSKSELSLRIFSEDRELRIDVDGTALPDERLAGAAVRWDWNVGSRTSIGIGADIADREDGGRDDSLNRLQFDVAYRVTARVSARLEASRSEQEGNLSSDADYTETQLRLLLRTEFR